MSDREELGTSVSEDVTVLHRIEEESESDNSGDSGEEILIQEVRERSSKSQRYAGIHLYRLDGTKKPPDRFRLVLIFILRFSCITFFAWMVLLFPKTAYVVSLVLLALVSIDTVAAFFAFIGFKMRIGTYPYSLSNSVCTLCECVLSHGINNAPTSDKPVVSTGDEVH